MLNSDHRIAVLLNGGIRGTQGKTGLALLRFRPDAIAVIIDPDCAGKSLRSLMNIPCDAPIVASVSAALAYQPDVLAIGIAPSGGALPDEWLPELKQAVALGLSILNGLHTRLGDLPEFQALLQPKQWIWDIRQEPLGLKVGSGQARELPCRRVLTVGTDMSVGKMSTSLALDRVGQKRGLRSRFLGTGQAGIMIAGDGIALDAVRVDFASGAVEQLVMRHGKNCDILHIEGQGSLFNPASTATLPLLRGSQPTHLILVHRAGQLQIRNFPQVSIPPLKDVVSVYETVTAAGGSFALATVAGIALNTAHLDQDGAMSAIATTQKETGLPCTDPIRFGADLLLDAILDREISIVK
ncbi:DUF1611 domain-containing protein [Myxacorys almedinensis]|uniref:DUF1611 domain-containing protein n=1 Tax=Myxacorys almedinensis A TaxID=2690445 RepID=A0A8J8CIM9_9CYAN|nr:DUF1611 domain-containing protein [Myxacorys almedinensis]NDJ18033.1 DUF1611 domain-containing protein [Myxacorys almedinensis A]